MAPGSPERRYRLCARVRAGGTDSPWCGGLQDQWWLDGWGGAYLWHSSPTLLIGSRGKRLYLGAIVGARLDRTVGQPLRYDLALTEDRAGLVSQRETIALVERWWQERNEPGPWPLGVALDGWLRLDQPEVPLAWPGFPPVRHHAQRSPRRQPRVAGAWLNAGDASTPGLLREAVFGSGPSVAYFQAMTPEWADQTDLPSGALLLVDSEPEQPDRIDAVPADTAEVAATAGRSRHWLMIGLVLLALGAALVVAAVLLFTG